MTHRKAAKTILSITKIKSDKDLYGTMYRQLGWMVEYAYDRIEVFPKRYKHNVGLANDISAAVNASVEVTIQICQYNPFNNREQLLRALSAKLKYINYLLQIAYRLRCISAHQLEVWSGKVTEVDNTAVGIAMWLESERKAKGVEHDEKSENKAKR